eukprot:5510375-Alexandrium_andersonii.AAC.1
MHVQACSHIPWQSDGCGMVCQFVEHLRDLQKCAPAWPGLDHIDGTVPRTCGLLCRYMYAREYISFALAWVGGLGA